MDEMREGSPNVINLKAETFAQLVENGHYLQFVEKNLSNSKKISFGNGGLKTEVA